MCVCVLNNQIFIFEINESITAETYPFACNDMHARGPLYSNSAVIAWWLQSTSAQNSVIFWSIFTSENIHRELLSLIKPAVYLHNIFCGLSDSRFSARVMPKCDFFLKKRLKEIFAYVLEFMLTFDKMQYTGRSLMCTNFEI